jgi:hypothetical protein
MMLMRRMIPIVVVVVVVLMTLLSFQSRTANAADNGTIDAHVMAHTSQDPPLQQQEQEKRQLQPPPCSLNGVLLVKKNEDGDVDYDNKECLCDAPWSGPDCSTLTFEPLPSLSSFPQGYGMAPNVTSWGGGVIYSNDDGMYHLFVAAMTNQCTLRYWTTNSRIDHATSPNVTGPYTFQDVAISTWSHNPAPLVLPDGTYAIIHIGTGDGPPNGGMNCSSSRILSPPPPHSRRERNYLSKEEEEEEDDSERDRLMEPLQQVHLPQQRQEQPPQRRVRATYSSSSSSLSSLSPFSFSLSRSSDLGGGGSTIHTSKSLNGPWVPLNDTSSSTSSLGSCNNPSPYVHPNGTIFVLCNNRILKRAEHITGPWTDVPNFSMNHSGGVGGNYEDGQLYIMRKHPGGVGSTSTSTSSSTTQEESFHILWHVYNTTEHAPHGHECYDSTVSAHSYSVDGITWFTSSIQPYTTQVLLSSGLSITVATRERPKLVFNTLGQMTHLINGVCSAPACPNGPQTGCVDCKYDSWDFTLVVPLVVAQEQQQQQEMRTTTTTSKEVSQE